MHFFSTNCYVPEKMRWSFRLFLYTPGSFQLVHYFNVNIQSRIYVFGNAWFSFFKLIVKILFSYLFPLRLRGLESSNTLALANYSSLYYLFQLWNFFVDQVYWRWSRSHIQGGIIFMIDYKRFWIYIVSVGCCFKDRLAELQVFALVLLLVDSFDIFQWL